MSTHSYACPIDVDDLDARQHVANGSLLRYAEQARHRLFSDMYQVSDVTPAGLVVTEQHVSYIQPLPYLGRQPKAEVRSHVSRLTAFGAMIASTIHSGNDPDCTRAEVTVKVTAMHDDGRPRRLSAAESKAIKLLLA